jgi:hypothetical protein
MYADGLDVGGVEHAQPCLAAPSVHSSSHLQRQHVRQGCATGLCQGLTYSGQYEAKGTNDVT